MTERPQTREEFLLAITARLIDEGLDLHAARMHAISIVCLHWPLTEYTDEDAKADQRSPESLQWWHQ